MNQLRFPNIAGIGITAVAALCLSKVSTAAEPVCAPNEVSVPSSAVVTEVRTEVLRRDRRKPNDGWVGGQTGEIREFKDHQVLVLGDQSYKIASSTTYQITPSKEPGAKPDEYLHIQLTLSRETLRQVLSQTYGQKKGGDAMAPLKAAIQIDAGRKPQEDLVLHVFHRDSSRGSSVGDHPLLKFSYPVSQKPGDYTDLALILHFANQAQTKQFQVCQPAPAPAPAVEERVQTRRAIPAD